MSALRVRYKPDIGITLDVRPRTQRRQAMAGKAIGEFSFKLVAINNSPGPAGSVLIQVSWEGTGTGFGAIFNTVTYVGGPKGNAHFAVGIE
jgi:hypothetical protein